MTTVAPLGSLTLRRMPAFGIAVAGVVAAGIGLRGVLHTVADLYPRSLPAHPFLVPEHALLLYVAMPLALLGAVAMLLVPGLLLALILGGSSRAGDLAVASFGGAFLIRVLIHSALKLSGVVPLGMIAFAVTEVVVDVVLLGVLALRLRSERPVSLPSEAPDRRRVRWMIAITVLTAVLLLPALFWQDMTDDGMEALEIGRSMATQIVPRFPGTPSGLMGLGIGMVTMAVPNGWFVSLIGPVEAAARLPLALYMPLLFVVIASLAEHGSTRRLGIRDEGAIVLALAVYVVTMVFSASYTNYSADASSPAAFDTLAFLCIAATILSAWEGRIGWMLVLALLACFARPTGLLMLGMLAIGTIALAPVERRTQLLRLGLAIGVCLAVATLYEKVYLPLAAHGGGVPFSSDSFDDRMRYVTFIDFGRVLFLVIPGGILPALALLAWRRQDPHSRQLVLVAALYFLFFYAQAFIALHHFVPVMLLPIVVYWRMALASGGRWWAGAAALAAGLSLALSLPRSFALDRSTRDIGRATEVRVGNLNGDWPAYREALRARIGLRSLFPLEWNVADPAQERVGTPLAVLYYSSRSRTAADTVNYLIQTEGTASPAGFSAVPGQKGLAVFVRDTARWRRDRETPPRVDYRAVPYDIPRSTLHRFFGVRAHAYQIDLTKVPVLWRLF